jgi:hypothetical protein
MQFFSWLHGHTPQTISLEDTHGTHQSHNLCQHHPARLSRISCVSQASPPKFLGDLRQVAWQRQLARSRPRAFISDQESRAELRMPTATRCVRGPPLWKASTRASGPRKTLRHARHRSSHRRSSHRRSSHQRSPRATPAPRPASFRPPSARQDQPAPCSPTDRRRHGVPPPLLVLPDECARRRTGRQERRRRPAVASAAAASTSCCFGSRGLTSPSPSSPAGRAAASSRWASSSRRSPWGSTR